jgi:hypothetical protein
MPSDLILRFQSSEGSVNFTYREKGINVVIKEDYHKIGLWTKTFLDYQSLKSSESS